MWGCPPQQSSPFSWPGEGGQVEDYARRGDGVDRPVDLTLIAWKSRLERRPKSIFAIRAFQIAGMGKANTPKSELLQSIQFRHCPIGSYPDE